MAIMTLKQDVYDEVHPVSYALDLERDTDGWTIFEPSSESRIMYVSEDGNDTTGAVYGATDFTDTRDPDGDVLSFATYAEAFNNARSGYPDWILFKRGDTFYETIGAQIYNGLSKSEPFFVGNYGSTGNIPVLKIGSAMGIEMGFANSAAVHTEYIALQGIDFYAHTRDPESVEYVSSDSDGPGIRVFTFGANNSFANILIEGCKCRYCSISIYATGGSPWGKDIDLRRNIIYKNYSTGGHAQGMWAQYINRFNVEENIFDHNGWLIQSVEGNSDASDGQATMFNHNIYASGLTNTRYSNNLFLRSSSMHNKFTAADADTYESQGYTNEDVKMEYLEIMGNFYTDGELGISVTGNYPENHHGAVRPVFKNNVFYNIGTSNPTNRGVSWCITHSHSIGSKISNNLLLNNLVGLTNMFGIYIATETENVEVYDNYIAEDNSSGLIWTSSDNVNVNVFNNYIKNKDGDDMVQADAPLTGFTFSNNQYYRVDGAYNYRVDGVSLSNTEWVNTYESDALFEERTVLDDSRTLETYLVYVGDSEDLDIFYTNVVAQDMFSWLSKYKAENINKWIMDGYSL